MGACEESFMLAVFPREFLTWSPLHPIKSRHTKPRPARPSGFTPRLSSQEPGTGPGKWHHWHDAIVLHTMHACKHDFLHTHTNIFVSCIYLICPCMQHAATHAYRHRCLNMLSIWLDYCIEMIPGVWIRIPGPLGHISSWGVLFLVANNGRHW